MQQATNQSLCYLLDSKSWSGLSSSIYQRWWQFSVSTELASGGVEALHIYRKQNLKTSCFFGSDSGLWYTITYWSSGKTVPNSPSMGGVHGWTSTSWPGFFEYTWEMEKVNGEDNPTAYTKDLWLHLPCSICTPTTCHWLSHASSSMQMTSATVPNRTLSLHMLHTHYIIRYML